MSPEALKIAECVMYFYGDPLENPHGVGPGPLNEWPGPVCKCGSCELCKCINIWTAFCHSLLMLYAHMILLSWRYMYYMWMICIFEYVFTCMHACVCFCVYALIGVYACMYMCTLLFLILICVCILSSFHPHNHHLSPYSPRLMFLFVDCATVNKVYLALSLSYLKCIFNVCHLQNDRHFVLAPKYEQNHGWLW